MINLADYIIEGAGHYKNRLGGGSSGVVYDLHNGYVRKTMRVLTKTQGTRSKEFDMLDKWAKVRKGLKVIPYIKNWDGDSYDIEKLQPCEESQWIETALFSCLFGPKGLEDDAKIKKTYQKLGDEKAKFAINWLKDFYNDGNLIIGNTNWSDDVRAMNIGKDKEGNVKIFDWFDPYC